MQPRSLSQGVTARPGIRQLASALRKRPCFHASTLCRSGFLEAVVSNGCGAFALSGCTLSGLFLLRDVDRFTKLTEAKQQAVAEAAEEDASFVFAVATVVSCVPLINWMVRHRSA